jgi:hypothetical protein
MAGAGVDVALQIGLYCVGVCTNCHRNGGLKDLFFKIITDGISINGETDYK